MMMSGLIDLLARVKCEPNLDKMAERVQHLFKFNHFYDQMVFNMEQRLDISKSIIQLTDPSESCELVKRRS